MRPSPTILPHILIFYSYIILLTPNLFTLKYILWTQYSNVSESPFTIDKYLESPFTIDKYLTSVQIIASNQSYRSLEIVINSQQVIDLYLM
jgi:hypothetical protein